MGLNFLVGIVSVSFENVMVGEGNAVLEGMNDLNNEYCIEENPAPEEDIDFIIMMKTIDPDEEEDASGVVEQVKQELHSLDLALQTDAI